jgi:hypothetical protein
MSHNDQGYSIHERVFDRREVTQLLEALNSANLERTKAGARHVLKLPAVRELSNDRRLMMLAGEFVGPAPIPFRATLFDKSANANWLVVWHQDTALPLRSRIDDADWGPWSRKAGVLYAHAPAWALERVVALRVSLDDSTPMNGPLRVLPDTHRGDVFTGDEIANIAASIRPVECVVPAGGVVAMRPLTLHASSKSLDDRRRRVLHIEYASATVIAPGIELA